MKHIRLNEMLFIANKEMLSLLLSTARRLNETKRGIQAENTLIDWAWGWVALGIDSGTMVTQDDLTLTAGDAYPFRL